MNDVLELEFATMKILAIKARRLGDTVLWTSALEALKSLQPEVLDIAYSKFYSELFEQDPRFQEQYLLSGSVKENLKFVLPWQKKQYDYVLNFHASPSSHLLASLSGARQKVIHFHDRNAKVAQGSLAIPGLGKPMSAIDRDLNVVRAIGWKGEAHPTKIYFNETVEKIKRRVIFGLGASRPSKQYSLEYFLRASALLSPEYEIIFNHDSMSLFEQNPFWKREFLRYGKIEVTQDLKSLMRLLSTSELYVGSDSGVKHLAIALGIKTLTLFGPESIGEWHGYDLTRNPVLQVDLACRNQDPEDKKFAWCGAFVCPQGSHGCMNLILPEEVVAVVRNIL